MINLIPPEEKEFLLKEQKKKLLIVLAIEIIVFLISLTLVFLIVMFYIMGMSIYQRTDLQNLESGIKSSDFSKLKSAILRYNKDLYSIDLFYKTQKSLSKALEILFSIQKPEGLYFNSVALSSEQKPGRLKFDISGTSITRDALLVFKAVSYTHLTLPTIYSV